MYQIVIDVLTNASKKIEETEQERPKYIGYLKSTSILMLITDSTVLKYIFN